MRTQEGGKSLKNVIELQKLLKDGVEISVRENGREKKIKYIGFFESGKMVIEVGK